MYESVNYEEVVAETLCLAHLTRTSSLNAGDVSSLFRAVRDMPIVQRLFDGLSLHLYRDGEGFVTEQCYFTENLDSFDISTVFPEIPWTEAFEITNIPMCHCQSALLCPLISGTSFHGVMGFFRTYSEVFRPEERAAAQLLSLQVSCALENWILRKKLELQNIALTYERDFSDKIFASINSGIIVTDGQGIILTANPYALQDLELCAEEILGSHLDEIIPGIEEAARSNEREGIFAIKGGKTVYLGFNVSPLKGSEGLSGAIILFRDITEIMHLRKELRRKEYFSTIGRMASWVAHEVRTPVFAISSITSILQKEIRDPEQEKFLASILKETTTLNMLVDDLLMYGKPLTLKTERVIIGDFLDEISDGINSIARQMGGRIEIPPGALGMFVEVDRERMKQVLYNLVKNAFEAGADLVTVETALNDGDALVTVRDNGKGIKESELSEMFTPFFTTKKSGTGLGLSICRKIIDEHDGSIQISSISGIGAEVNIRLPAL